MVSYDKGFNYEAMLETLKATHESMKRKFTERKHLLSDEDRAFERFLFTLEEDALTGKDNPEKVVVLSNFDDLMNEISGAEVPEYSDPSIRELESMSGSCSDKKHTCTHPGCAKSYTSSHGLKYHLLHGHSIEKENVYKPFICTEAKCKKSYRNSNGLKYHLATAHGKGTKK